jgi:hypothetical protein
MHLGTRSRTMGRLRYNGAPQVQWGASGRHVARDFSLEPFGRMITHNETFDIERPRVPSAGGDFVMSDHAMKRMYERGFSPGDIRLALRHGDPVYDRGARIYRIGKKEVRRVECPRLREIKGVQVVCAHSGVVKTLYRNRDFRAVKTTHAPR